MSLDRAAILGGEPLNPAGSPSWPIFDPAVADVVAAAMADGSWGRYLGRHCDSLRDVLAEYHGVPHAHLCSSGTSAVELALRGVDVGPGDEVILAAYDFEANFKNVLALGAMPVLVDARAEDAQIDVQQVEEAGGDRVKAVVASHLHGGVVDMIRLRDLCDRRGWSLVDDACQAPGAFVQGRRAGTWGDAGVLSFGGSKLLTAGRGGCVLTSRDDVLQRIRLHVLRGNDLSPLSELQAVALLPQLARLDEQNAIRSANVDRLRRGCANIQGLTMFALTSGGRQPSENTPVDPPAKSRPSDAPRSSTVPAYYKVGLWYDSAAFAGLSRERFTAAVRAEGVALSPGFRGLHRIHSRKRFRSVGELAVADAADEKLVVLHHPVLLSTADDVDRIAAAIRKIQRFAPAIRDAERPVA